ncbi:MAG: hypothetical protein HC828_18050 [Blastochloris sp.]|nr:hypothetical protein [Blastochloris sp.]
MIHTVYIGLTDDEYWALFLGDGTEDEPYPIVVHTPFEPGDAIRQAVADLTAWAAANRYTLVTPKYSRAKLPPSFYTDTFDAE